MNSYEPIPDAPIEELAAAARAYRTRARQAWDQQWNYQGFGEISGSFFKISIIIGLGTLIYLIIS